MVKSLVASRRRFLAVTTAAGLGHTLLPGALLALATGASAQTPAKGSADAAEEKLLPITVEMIEQAAAIAGVRFTAEQRRVMIDNLTGQRDDLVEVRKLVLPNAVAPSLVFDPVAPGAVLETRRKAPKLDAAPHIVSIAGEGHEVSAAGLEQLVYETDRQLGELLRTKKITSVELTTMYIARLKRFDPQLHFVITLTEERAMKQAEQA